MNAGSLTGQMVFLALVLGGYGLFLVINPRLGWKASTWKQSWMYKNPQPAPNILKYVRIMGGVTILVAIGIVIYAAVSY